MAATGKGWNFGSPIVIDDKDKKEAVTIASDDKIVVVGCAGWDGVARVYDIATRELKFTLVCNQLQDMPAPFSWDKIVADIGNSVIVTFSSNDNTLCLWDRDDGSMLYRNFESKGESDFIAKFRGMYTKTHDTIRCVKAIGDKILVGTEHGLETLENVDGKWKNTGKSGPEDHQIYDIDVDGKWAVFTAIGSSVENIERDTPVKLFLWDLEEEKLVPEFTRDSSLYRDVTLAYPYVFLVGSLKNSPHKFGLRMINLETGEMVRQVLKDEKKYDAVHANGNLVAICELINSWSSDEEYLLKLAIYDVKELSNSEISEDNLWCKEFEYRIDGNTMSGEHIRCTLTSKNLVVNHDATKISILEISKEE